MEEHIITVEQKVEETKVEKKTIKGWIKENKKKIIVVGTAIVGGILTIAVAMAKMQSGDSEDDYEVDYICGGDDDGSMSNDIMDVVNETLAEVGEF